MGRNATRLGEGRSEMIFAAKTTASGLIALFVAFTFNLDQPQWALLAVFIGMAGTARRKNTTLSLSRSEA
jgi:uncharacterized membrane protein YccC